MTTAWSIRIPTEIEMPARLMMLEDIPKSRISKKLNKNGHRQRHGDDKRISQVPHHQNDRDRAHDQLFLDRAADGFDRLVNQRCAVVERNDSHALRAARV